MLSRLALLFVLVAAEESAWFTVSEAIEDGLRDGHGPAEKDEDVDVSMEGKSLAETEDESACDDAFTTTTTTTTLCQFRNSAILSHLCYTEVETYEYDPYAFFGSGSKHGTPFTYQKGDEDGEPVVVTRNTVNGPITEGGKGFFDEATVSFFDTEFGFFDSKLGFFDTDPWQVGKGAPFELINSFFDVDTKSFFDGDTLSFFDNDLQLTLGNSAGFFDFFDSTYATYNQYLSYGTYRTYEIVMETFTYLTYATYGWRSYRTRSYATYMTYEYWGTYKVLRTYATYRTYRTYQTYKTYEHSYLTYRTYATYWNTENYEYADNEATETETGDATNPALAELQASMVETNKKTMNKLTEAFATARANLLGDH